MTLPSNEDFKRWYREHSEEILQDFFTFLSFPSISTDPQFSAEMQKTAVWLSAYLNKIGLESSVWETSGKPIVYATHLKAGKNAPTILIYHHYDVQPVDPLELWHSNPFQPVIKNRVVYARGALDNKGQCFNSICAIRAFLELSGQCNFNLKVFIEGEEECGSKGTAAFLAQKKIDLRADHLFVIDFNLPKEHVPGITLGMRGIVSLSVTFKNATHDLHSGLHGGIALSANRALVQTLTRLWDEKGRVLVPGFYDGIQQLSKAQQDRLELTFDVDEYRKKFGVNAFANENNVTPLEANWLRPALEINGICGGYTGAGVKTVIPAKAEAKLSCRLVPGQDPQKIGQSILDFLQQQAPKGVEVRGELYEGAEAFQASFDAPATKLAAQALSEVFGKPCLFQLCGASVPIIPLLVEVSKANAVLMGMGLDDDSIHAPNEHFNMDRFELGFLTLSRILASMNLSR